jgi:hypothetical protein
MASVQPNGRIKKGEVSEIKPVIESNIILNQEFSIYSFRRESGQRLLPSRVGGWT